MKAQGSAPISSRYCNCRAEVGRLLDFPDDTMHFIFTACASAWALGTVAKAAVSAGCPADTHWHSEPISGPFGIL